MDLLTCQGKFVLIVTHDPLLALMGSRRIVHGERRDEGSSGYHRRRTEGRCGAECLFRKALCGTDQDPLGEEPVRI